MMGGKSFRRTLLLVRQRDSSEEAGELPISALGASPLGKRRCAAGKDGHKG
jgi:hypothetical protein